MTTTLLQETLSYPLPTQRSSVARISSRVAVRWNAPLGVLVVDCEAAHIHGCERGEGDNDPCTCRPSFPAGRRRVEDVRDWTSADIVRLAVEAADSWRAEVGRAVAQQREKHPVEVDHAAA